MKKDATLKLTFTEKFFLKGLMPEKDSFENLLIRRDLIEKIGYTEEDVKKNNLIQTGENLTWKDCGEKIMVTINASEKNYIKTKLIAESDSKNLNAALIDVYKEIL